MKVLAHLTAMVLLSMAVAVVGLGISFERELTPRASDGQFSLVYGDGWFVDGATIRFPDLGSRGNRLLLELEPRSGGVEPARVRVLVCGATASEFVVAEHKTETVYLTGSCNPRVVSFEVLNPFIPSATDSRKLGAKLDSVRVTSRLGLPIVHETLLIQAAMALFVLTLLAWGASGRSLLALILPILALPIFSLAPDLDLFKVWSLWLWCVAFAAGAFLYRAVPNQSREREDVAELSWGRGWTLAALVVTVGGGALRFYGIDFGLPQNFHPDEVPKVNAIMRMVDNGDLNPRYFLHPTLLLYCTYFMNNLLHTFGIGGEFRDSLVLAGRLVSATGGTVSVFLTFLIGRRLLTARSGLLAAAILAVMPLHVTCSRYLKEDALLLTFILAGTATMLFAVQERRHRWMLVAGGFMGLAMSVKYSGLLAGGILAAAPWLASREIRPDPKMLRWTVLAGLMMPVGFLLSSPYVILYSTRFVKDFSSEQRHMLRGHGGEITAWSQLWMYHFGRSALPGASTLVSLAAVAGAAILLLKRRIEGWFIVWGIVLFYMPAEWVRAKPAPQPERYILPCMPFMALAAAAMAEWLWNGRRTLLVGALAALLFIAVPAERSLELAAELKRDTRILMAKWIRHHIPPGSTIYMDWKPYNPRLDEQTYNVVYIDRATILQQLQLEELAKRGPGYLSLSSLYYDRHFSQPNSPTMPRLVFRNIFENLPLVHEITPQAGTYGFHNPTLRLYALTPEDAARITQTAEGVKAP